MSVGALVLRSLLAANVLLAYDDDHRIRTVLELHAGDHRHRRVTAVVIHAHALVAQADDADAVGSAAFQRNLALDGIVGQVAIFVVARLVFAKALRRTAHAGDVPDGARLARCLA